MRTAFRNRRRLSMVTVFFLFSILFPIFLRHFAIPLINMWLNQAENIFQFMSTPHPIAFTLLLLLILFSATQNALSVLDWMVTERTKQKAINNWRKPPQNIWFLNRSVCTMWTYLDDEKWIEIFARTFQMQWQPSSQQQQQQQQHNHQI